MRGMLLKNHLVFLILITPVFLYAQANQGDCNGAIVVCGDTSVDVIDDTGDILDFNDPDNNLGCHLTGEASSTWLYFSFTDDMPANSELLFTIAPFESGEIDYDFALYDADVACDSLGDPLRCSYSWAFSNGTFDCGFCPETGLGNGETDTSEDPFGNGFVAPINVNPGQGFYLYINEFYDQTTGSLSDGFNISFGGLAADFFDCAVNPNCDQVTVDLGNDTTLCSGEFPYQLSSELTYATGFETYTWTGPNGEVAYLNDSTSATPIVSLPDLNTVSQLTYYLYVSSGDCIKGDTITIDILETVPFTLPEDTTICEGSNLIVNAGNGFESYLWSNDSTTNFINIDTAGTYYVTVTAASNQGGCTIIDSIVVDLSPPPSPMIMGPDMLCPGDTIILDGGSGYQSYTWNGMPGGQFLEVTTAGGYILEVSNDFGCIGQTTHTVSFFTSPSVTISGPVGLCPGDNGILDAGTGYASYLWSNDSTTQTMPVTTPGYYSVTVTTSDGCRDEASINVQAFSNPQPQIDGDTILCYGTSTLLNSAFPHNTYLWSTTDQVPAILVNQAGTYYLTVTNNDGCIGVDSINIIQNDSLPVDINVLLNEPLCLNDTVFLTATPGYNNYEWSNGTFGPLTLVDAQGTYHVTVTDDVGCTASDSLFIPINPLPQPDIIGPAGLCPDDTATLEIAFFNFIEWDDGTDNPTLNISAPGTYTVTVTDITGCSASDTIQIGAFSNPAPMITGADTLCEGTNTLLSVSQPFSSYEWSVNNSQVPAILVNSSGFYSITVTNADGCSGADTIDIVGIAAPMLDLPDTAFFCEGDSTTIGTVDVFNSYSWNTTDTTQMINVNTPGFYTLVVTGDNGCQASDEVLVIMDTIPISGLDDDYGFCQGEMVTIFANPGLSTYEWSTTDQEDSIVINTAGTYFLTITDANNCSSIDTFNVAENMLPMVDIIASNDLCEGDTATLTVSGSFNAYIWQDGSMDSFYVADTPGLYEISVTDVNGCIGSNILQVNELPAPEIPIDTLQDFCIGDTLELNAGNGFITYLWEGGSIGQTLEVDNGGFYGITVTDINGCEGDAVVEVIENALPNPPIDGNLYFCYQDSTTLAVTGNNIATYNWSTGGTDSIEVFDMAGMYTLSIVDTNNCSNLLPIVISEQAEIIPTINGINLICDGDQAMLNAEAGFDEYLWSTGDLTASINADTAGTYTVTVTDNLGCQGANNFNLNVLMLPDPMLEDSAYLCEDGISTLSAASGLASYSWNTTDTTQSIEVTQSGTYSITVTDSFGCSNTEQIEVLDIDVPAPLIGGDLSICPGDTNLLVVDTVYVDYSWSTNDSTSSIQITEAGFYQVSVTSPGGCEGTSNIFVVMADSIDVAIMGAADFCIGDSIQLSTDVYISYEWSNGDLTQNTDIRETGSYSVTVTDSQGCSASDTVLINVFDLPDPALPDSLVICEGNNIDIVAVDSFLVYEWQDGSNTDIYQTMSSGTYTLTVTDNNGCIGADTTITFIQPTPQPNIAGANNFCPGDSISLTVDAGWSAILWSNNDTTNTSIIYDPGVYAIDVTDSLGCIGSTMVQIDTFVVNIPSIQAPAGICPNDTVTLMADSGYAIYEWSNSMNTPDIQIDSAATYTLTVTDNNGCISSNSLQLNTFPTPQVNIVGQDSICEGLSSMLSSNMPFQSYEWSTTDQTISIDAGMAGDYMLTVTDLNGCSTADTLTLTVVALPVPNIIGDAFICDDTSTLLTVSQSYQSYAWSNGLQSAQIQADTAGNYIVTVTDAFGCEGTGNFDLTVNPLPQPTILGANEFCTGDSILLQSNMAFDSLWWNTGTGTNQISVSLPGLYILNAQNEFGCTAADSLQVEELSLPTVTLMGDTFFCVGDSIQLTAISDGQIQEWNTGEDTPSISVSSQGTYSVIVINQNGCTATDSLDIFSTEIPVANAGLDGILDCANETINIGGDLVPIPNLVYEWVGPDIDSDNQYDASPEIGIEGTYFLQVTDTLTGCISLVDFTTIEDLRYEPIAVINLNDTLDCQTSSIFLDANGSTIGPDMIYEWLGPDNNSIPGAINLSLNATAIGTYTFIVLDTITSCTAMTTQLVAGTFTPPSLSIEEPDTITCINNSVDINATASAPSGTLSLQWLDEMQLPIFGEDNPSINVNTPMWYYLLATDLDNGCQNLDSVLVTANITYPDADAGENQEIDCLTSEVTLNGSASSQNGNYEYIWSSENGYSISGTLLPEVSEEGWYYLTVNNPSNGCATIDSVLVTISDGFLTGFEAYLIDPTCYGDQNGVISIQNIEGGTPPFMYSIDGGPYSNQQSFAGLSAGNYMLSVEDVIGCTYELPVQLQDGNIVVVELGEAEDLNLGEELQIVAQTNLSEPEIGQISWWPSDSTNCQDCLIYSSYPTQSGLVQISVMDTSGCVGTDQVQVILRKERKVYIPNGFSPNADGANDIFYINGGPDVVRIHNFNIFDRWGNHVFGQPEGPPNDPAYGWDGHFKGEPFDPAVFTYFVEIEFTDGSIELFEGDISLVK